MKKLVVMLAFVSILFISCGMHEKTELSNDEMVEANNEDIDEGDTMINYFELCKVEEITETEVILYSRSAKCIYKVDLSEGKDLVVGEYYDVEFEDKKEISENTYSIDSPKFYHEDFREEIIKN